MEFVCVIHVPNLGLTFAAYALYVQCLPQDWNYDEILCSCYEPRMRCYAFFLLLWYSANSSTLASVILMIVVYAHCPIIHCVAYFSHKFIIFHENFAS
jgi:hypothetical protein